MDNRTPVTLDSYNAKKAQRDDKMDLVIKSSTKILPSPNQFDIPAKHVDFENKTSKSVCLSFIHDIEVYMYMYEHVSVVINIISIGGENHCF